MDRLRQQTEKFLDTEVIKTETWAETLYDSLRALGITIFCYVPDAGHRVLIERSIVDDNVVSIPLTTEEEGVALLAGAHLGGKRGVLLMQSSGVGNCINMMSLINAGRFPFLTIVSMRGDFGEQNPWQLPMGQAVEPCLTAMDTLCLRIETPEDITSTTEAATQMAYKSDQSVAIILSQKLIGAKPF